MKERTGKIYIKIWLFKHTYYGCFFRRRGFIIKNGKYIKRDEYRSKMLDQISGGVPFRAQMIADKFKKTEFLQIHQISLKHLALKIIQK